MKTHAVLYCNKGLEKLWGVDIDRVLSSGGDKLWSSLLYAEDRERALALSKRMFDGERADEEEIEYRIVRSDGKLLWIGEKFSTIRNSKGRAYLIASIASDITARKKLEGKLMQAERLEAVGRLAGGVAHDLNNLLVPILGYSDILNDDDMLDLDQKEIVHQLIEAEGRAKELVDRLLSFARKKNLEFSRIELNKVILDFHKLLRHSINKDINLELNLEEALSPIMADRNQLEQILMNLVMNAQYAMERGGLIKIETGMVSSLSTRYIPQTILESSNNWIYLQVEDNGHGILPFLSCLGSLRG